MYLDPFSKRISTITVKKYFQSAIAYSVNYAHCTHLFMRIKFLKFCGLKQRFFFADLVRLLRDFTFCCVRK